MGIGRRLGALGQAALGLVYERVCAACKGALRGGDRDVAVCALCWARVRGMPRPRCARCEHPVDRGAPEDESCPGCAELLPSIARVRSFTAHDPAARRIVHALKFGGWSCVADPMAERMAGVLAAVPRDRLAAVVAVPTTPARRRERGYDQAELLARGVAARLGLPFAGDRLHRIRASRPQARLHRQERMRNVASAFAAQPGPRSGIGEHLVLVDDVWTTGATASACVSALVEAGTRTVTVLTFARVLPDRDSRSDR